MGGMLIHYFSKTQSIVTLSSTEAEYCVFTPAVQEIMFQLMLLEEWNLGVKPAFILEDNQAAIFLVRNQCVGQRTKHIDIRYHFIRQHFPDKFVPMFVDSENNDSDMMTKNQSTDLFKKHSYNISNDNTYVRQVWKRLVNSYNDGTYFTQGRMS